MDLEKIRNTEAGYADAFKDFMRSEAEINNGRFHGFPMGGQDVELGADYVISDSSRFALIEFKFTENDCISENRKPRRLSLCQKLPENPTIKGLHDACHFISWIDSFSDIAQVNIYRQEVCNRAVFGAAGNLEAYNPNIQSRMTGSQFADKYFQENSEVSLAYEDFNKYVTWILTETSKSPYTHVQFLVRDLTTRELKLLPLTTLDAVYKWMQQVPKMRGATPTGISQTAHSGKPSPDEDDDDTPSPSM
jgi:hypothetical protein